MLCAHVTQFVQTCSGEEEGEGEEDEDEEEDDEDDEDEDEGAPNEQDDGGVGAMAEQAAPS